MFCYNLSNWNIIMFLSHPPQTHYFHRILSSYLCFPIPESQFSNPEYRISLSQPIRSSTDSNIFYSKLQGTAYQYAEHAIFIQEAVFKKNPANFTAVGVELSRIGCAMP